MKLNFKVEHKKIWFDSMIGMTWGFIASLIVGTVIGLFGLYSKANIFVSIKNIMSFATPMAIGVGVGIKTKMKPLQIFAMAIGVFLIGQSSIKPTYYGGHFIWSIHSVETSYIFNLENNFLHGLPGDVFGAWIGSVLFTYIFKIFTWQSFFDILVVPILGVFLGLTCSFFVTYITSTILVILEWIIDNTVMQSWWAAVLLAPIIGILMGLALSLPTSSAAIAFALSLHGWAATAAIAGTAAQMISFGVLTYMATGSVSKSIAVGLGTTMLQLNNFVKRPKVLLIPILASGISALIGVLAFKDLAWPLDALPDGQTLGSTATGMGACMLYGQIFTLKINGWSNVDAWLNIIFIQILIPIIIGLVLGKISFRKNFLKKEWLEISHA